MLHRVVLLKRLTRKVCLLFAVACIVLSAVETSTFAQALLIGKVLDAETGAPLENARVRIVRSGFKEKTDKSGRFSLPYVPGNFMFAVEREGYVPKGVPLSLSAEAKFPMEDIGLDRFPALVDMYLNSVAEVEIKVKQQDYSGRGAILATAKTNAMGQFLLEYAPGELEVSVGKPGYKNMTMVVNMDRMPKIEKAVWVLPPENPGLYYQNRLLGSSQFTFRKKPMQGLMIPAYYDGTYSVTGEPEIVEGKVPQVFYFVPKHGRTFGENPFASKGGTFIFKVGNDGVFAKYDDGVSRAEKILNVKIEQVADDVQGTLGGLVQQKSQILRLEGNLPEGAYVLFQGGGNSMDREPHPDESLGCWHFRVRGIVGKP